MSDFSAPELRMISAILYAEKSLPDEMWAVEVVQELARLLAKLEPLLPNSDMAVLVGVGAMVARQGKQEMAAGIQAAAALAKAKETRT